MTVWGGGMREPMEGVTMSHAMQAPFHGVGGYGPYIITYGPYMIIKLVCGLHSWRFAFHATICVDLVSHIVLIKFTYVRGNFTFFVNESAFFDCGQHVCISESLTFWHTLVWTNSVLSVTQPGWDEFSLSFCDMNHFSAVCWDGKLHFAALLLSK